VVNRGVPDGGADPVERPEREGRLASTVDGRVPPGPRGNLLLGSLPAIRRDNVHAFLDGWRRYGDTVRFRGPMTLYLRVA
jgi:hypothetical protein